MKQVNIEGKDPISIEGKDPIFYESKQQAQTAVEWLCEQYHLKQDIEIVKQAKEMEKQQMIDFANDLLARNNKNYIALPDLAEQYYNETFKK